MRQYRVTNKLLGRCCVCSLEGVFVSPHCRIEHDIWRAAAHLSSQVHAVLNVKEMWMGKVYHYYI